MIAPIFVLALISINSYLLYRVFVKLSFRTLSLSIAIFNISIVCWQGVLIWITYVTDTELLHRLAFVFSSWALVSALGLSITYPNKSKLYRSTLISVPYLVNLVFTMLLLLSGAIISDYTGDVVFGIYGWLFLLFLAIVLIFIISVFVFRYKRDIHQRLHFRYVFFSFAIYGSFALVFNLFLPYIGFTEYTLIGAMGASIPVVAMVYTLLVKYLYKTNYWLGLLLFFMSKGLVIYFAFYLVVWLYTHLYGGIFNVNTYVLGVFISFLVVVLLSRYDKFLSKIFEGILYSGKSPTVIRDEFSSDLSTDLKLNSIFEKLAKLVLRVTNSEKIAIVLFSNDNIFEVFTKKFNFEDRSLLQAIRELGEIERDLVTDVEIYDNKKKYLQNFFHKNNIKIYIPMKMQNSEIKAAFLLGSSEVHEMYSKEDINLVGGLVKISSVAFSRGYLYREVQDLNRNLQKRVEEATEELQGKNARLEKALKKIEDIRQQERDMIDVMGHELRTPITIVRNALLVLQSKLKDRKRVETKSVKEYVEKAVESARREINLVETLLSATKVESNRIQLTLTKIDMLDVVNDSIEGHKGFAKDKKIKIDYKKPKKKIYGFADRTRIQEVMDNFLSNAIKYTMRGKVSISIKTDREYAAISITDTGIGISKADLKHLGKKFFRAKQYLKNDDGETNDVVRPGGTGLGLYVSFNLVRLMNGEVEVESEIGKGSTFTLKVPIYDGQKDKHIDQTFEEPI